jgi:hypothetical protein
LEERKAVERNRQPRQSDFVVPNLNAFGVSSARQYKPVSFSALRIIVGL